MGAATSELWEQGKPQVFKDLEHLKGWDRETLKDVYSLYRTTSSSVSVNIATFWRLLRFGDRESAALAFDMFAPKEGRVDFLMVLGPMVVMSDQHFISRASLLFSMYDFSGSGTVNRAEFFIAMRTLFRGLACFFKTVKALTQAEAHELAATVFDRIDEDRSDLMTLGEVLAFAYRGKAFRTLTLPFPSKDDRIYEEQVFFAGRGTGLQVAAAKTTKQMEQTLRNKIRLTPDPVEEGIARRRRMRGARERGRPWRPAAITRVQAWVMWRFFRHLAKGGRSIRLEELVTTLSDDLHAAKVLQEALADEQPQRWEEDDVEAPEGVSRILQHLCIQMVGGHVKERIEALAEAGCVDLSLRGLCCVVWHQLREADIETCVNWCRAYQAQSVLQELLKALREEDTDLNAEDVEELFEAIDGNGDGQLSMEELCSRGHIDEAWARRLLERMDCDHSGGLSKAEVKGVIYHVDHALKEQFKAAYSATQQRQAQ